MRARCDVDVLCGMCTAAASVWYLLYLSSLWLICALNLNTEVSHIYPYFQWKEI